MNGYQLFFIKSKCRKQDFIKETKQKYDEEFNYMCIDKSSSAFNMYKREIKSELTIIHSLFGKDFYSLAKCASRDDVLYYVRDNNKTYYIVIHLTFKHNENSKFLNYKIFNNILDVKEYLVKQYLDDFID